MYEWNPMPHAVDIRCPECKGLGVFEFAEVVRIRQKIDVPFFQESPVFEYRMFDGGTGAGRWHGALFYAGLKARAASAAGPLPEGYSASDWEHGECLYRSHGMDIGTATCAACGHRAKHTLSWPSDAYYQLEYRSEVLWAFHRESALDLRSFIASSTRDRSGYRWGAFLLHVPSGFLASKARTHVLKHLDRLLAS